MVSAEREEQVIAAQSAYLKYLPALYSESEFMGRFLMIFESILGPLEGMIDNMAYYLDPALCPEELLPWLASWMGLEMDYSWPVERRRELVASADFLFRWRGTRRGLREYLRLYTGVEPQITEDFGGIGLGGEHELGQNTVLGGGNQHVFTVTFEVDDANSINESRVRQIIETEKPAHAGYILRVVERDGQSAGEQSATE
ncbi:MAG: phage tail protein [Chloroflexota bacterium]|nr:phage tail protein [Chloroflexota bacterium]